MMTMQKSRMFQPLLRYALGAKRKSYEMILRVISITKKKVKT